MKLEIIFDKNLEEKVVVYAKENSGLVEDIKRLIEENSVNLVGYKDKEIINLNPVDVYCFTVIDNKICAICEKETFQLKERLYVLEKNLPENFLKINQSCIANINKIERFDASISGSLKIRFKNGYTDYVSRRQLKFIKERVGIV